MEWWNILNGYNHPSRGEAGDMRYASQSKIPKSPASPLHPSNEKTENHITSEIIFYAQINEKYTIEISQTNNNPINIINKNKLHTKICTTPLRELRKTSWHTTPPSTTGTPFAYKDMIIPNPELISSPFAAIKKNVFSEKLTQERCNYRLWEKLRNTNGYNYRNASRTFFWLHS